jgi:predicted HTH transcriptional regulator
MIPDKLEDWNIQIIDCLIPLRDIESETFDFKSADFKELSIHLCAMANTLGGTIVLSIDEVKDQQGHLTKYKKTGFVNNNKEDNVRNRVNNAMVNVEPIPKVSIRNVSDTNNKFILF